MVNTAAEHRLNAAVIEAFLHSADLTYRKHAGARSMPNDDGVFVNMLRYAATRSLLLISKQLVDHVTIQSH